VWFEDGSRAAETTVVMDESPLRPVDGEGVTRAQISACVAKDCGVVPSAICVFNP